MHEAGTRTAGIPVELVEGVLDVIELIVGEAKVLRLQLAGASHPLELSQNDENLISAATDNGATACQDQAEWWSVVRITHSMGYGPIKQHGEDHPRRVSGLHTYSCKK